jgi:hypothetical protein
MDVGRLRNRSPKRWAAKRDVSLRSPSPGGQHENIPADQRLAAWRRLSR